MNFAQIFDFTYDFGNFLKYFMTDANKSLLKVTICPY